MAKLQLNQSETDRDFLPSTCMMCGAPATDHIRKNFSWYPPWVGVFVLVAVPLFIIMALVMTKRMTVEVPVCDRHRGYWWKRQLFMFLPLVLFFALGVGAMVALGNGPNNDAGGIACAASVGIAIIWLIVAAVIQSLMVRPTEITDRTITLKNVNDDFERAVTEARRGRRSDRYDDDDDDDDDYDDRRRRRRERARDDDDLPPERRESYRPGRGDD